MAKATQDTVQKLLSENTFKIDTDKTNEDATCLICKKILNNPYQTHCGCLYCHGCVVGYLLNDKKYCQGNKAECKNEYLVLDENVCYSAMLNRKIFKVFVICPNESCTHSTELALMEEHLRVCTKQIGECPYLSIGCDVDNVTKDGLLSHLNSETLPHTQLLIDLINNLKNEVGALRINKIEIEGLKKENEQLRRESQENKDRIEMLEFETNAKLKKMESESNAKLKKMENESKAKLGQLEKECEDNKQSDRFKWAIDTINKGTNTTDDVGETVFTVDRFDARKTAKEETVSSYFYSHTNGYKVRLRVEPGGSGSGSDTHLSVYVQICKGEYDDVLPWPCKYSFNIAIINQRNGGTHKTMTFTYDTTADNCKNSFDKPSTKDNIGCGYGQFMSHSDLRSIDRLIVDDCVIIKCTASAPK